MGSVLKDMISTYFARLNCPCNGRVDGRKSPGLLIVRSGDIIRKNHTDAAVEILMLLIIFLKDFSQEAPGSSGSKMRKLPRGQVNI